MTHIDNILHILQNGITHSSSINANPNFIPIGDSTLITARNNHLLKNGKRLGEYIPFYFWGRMPMLYVIQKGYNMVVPASAENIVYCVSSVQKIIDLGLDFVFTDGHAVDSFSSQFTLPDINDIDMVLDLEAIKSRYWRDENDLDKKRRKEAEFLVLGDIAVDAILGYKVYNMDAKNKVIEFGADANLVQIEPSFYF